MDSIAGASSYYLNKYYMPLSSHLQQFCLSAKQCTSVSCIQHSQTAALQNSQLPFS